MIVHVMKIHLTKRSLTQKKASIFTSQSNPAYKLSVSVRTRSKNKFSPEDNTQINKKMQMKSFPPPRSRSLSVRFLATISTNYEEEEIQQIKKKSTR